MDQVLIPYASALGESARQERLAELLLFHAEPAIRRTLRRALGFNVGAGGLNPFNHDAEDLYQEVMTKVAQALHDLRTSSAKPKIENFKDYVGRIATNVCNDFLRTKIRTRFLLKHKLEDLLRRHPDLEIWEYQQRDVCGFAHWQESEVVPTTKEQIRELENDLGSFRAKHLAGRSNRQVRLSKLVPELLTWIGRPIGLEEFANTVALLLGVSSFPTESITIEGNPVIEASLADSRFRADSAYEVKALLTQLWKVVKALPASQRDASV